MTLRQFLDPVLQTIGSAARWMQKIVLPGSLGNIGTVNGLGLSRVALGSGIELDVLDVGPRNAPVLIFLHGFPESHRTWRHQVAHFSGQYRCIVPDQRGYCGSSKPPDLADYATQKLAKDVFDLAGALGITEFTIVGHDWGGALAWIVAAYRRVLGIGSASVKRAIIIDGAHPNIFARLVWTSPDQRKESQYITVFRDHANDPLVREQGLIGILRKAFGVNFSFYDTAEPAEREQLVRDWENRDAAFGMLNWYRASTLVIPDLSQPYTISLDAKLPRELPQIDIPTLVIWAINDIALDNDNLVELPRYAQNLKVIEVPDCGHFVPWEAPEVVNAAMDEFLGRTA